MKRRAGSRAFSILLIHSPAEAKARIEEALSQKLKKKVDLTVTEDRQLIGGVKVVVGGLRIDGTIRRQLEILNERIMKE